jgi:alpha-maltose-1-phosphate synthase
MTACIYYDPEAYTTTGPRLMGRHAAGESFLRGWLMHAKASEFWAQVQRPDHARHFTHTVQAAGRGEPVRIVDRRSLASLAQPGLVYHPGPGIGDQALHRAAFGHGAWSLCGITHTTASAGAMDSITSLITAPVQPWDALICTSSAVKDNVMRLLQAQADALRQRLGLTRIVLPQVPVIPLGIHTADFAFTLDQRASARAELAVTPDTLVVLFMGRLSFHAKAHPLAMYQALEAAARRTGKPVTLIECGWHANAPIRQAYAEAARLACPSVRVLTLDGREPLVRQRAWAGADVFCSLSDNIQESFGLTPIEAMAAGLPVVVSDWDGYKDTVRHGTDGFRIPTLMPQAGLGRDLALRHALDIDTYDQYCGHVCAMVAVDVQAATEALVRLFESPPLRRQMGSSGRQRARQTYDWKTVIGQYEALWAELRGLRETQARGLRPAGPPWPARMDPFQAFASYPTRTLTPQTRLRLVEADLTRALDRVRALRELAMVGYARGILPAAADIDTVLHKAAAGPATAMELVEHIGAQSPGQVLRATAWLVKLGVLELSE